MRTILVRSATPSTVPSLVAHAAVPRPAGGAPPASEVVGSARPAASAAPLPDRRIVERDLDAAPRAPRLTPLAARMAGDQKAGLSGIVGTGHSGRITRRDLELAAHATPPTVAVEPLSRTQRIMAERVIASFTSAPHFYLHAEVNARRLLTLREELLPVLEADSGLRLTITDLLVLICARALQQHPHAMAQYTPDGLRPAPGVHVGVATDTPGGLVVPVIRDANRLPLIDLVRRRSELIEHARAGKSPPQDFDAASSPSATWAPSGSAHSMPSLTRPRPPSWPWGALPTRHSRRTAS